MNGIKKVLLCLLIFIAGIIGAFYMEDSYRKLVRWLFNLFQGNRVVYVGKNFHLFASGYFLLAFAVFLVVVSLILFKLNNRNRIIYSIWTIAIFFITTALTTYIDSSCIIVNCIDCLEGVKKLHYNAINYDAHFVVSLLAALLPVAWVTIRNRKKGNRENHR